MAYQLVLPDIGEGVVEAEVLKWFVRPGDDVVEDQPIVEVMTDKATVVIPSPRRGRVAGLRFEEGQVAKVHDVLMELEVEGGGEVRPAVEHAPPAAPRREPEPPSLESRAAVAAASAHLPVPEVPG